jgi:hypothetical protein
MQLKVLKDLKLYLQNKKEKNCVEAKFHFEFLAFFMIKISHIQHCNSSVTPVQYICTLNKQIKHINYILWQRNLKKKTK